MPRQVVPLTESKVRNAKPRAKEYKLSDGGGLFLLVVPAGGKYWRMKYRFGGKEMAPLAFGVYPEVSLAEARERREAARKKLRHGVDPREQQKALKAAKVAEAENSFEVVAREWYARWSPGWSPSHAATVIGRLNLDVFPRLGARPIGEITASAVLKMLRAIEFRGALETAHRVRTICGQVFRYAVSTGRAELGYKGKQTAHGFRATARTILDEVLQQRPEYIEHQLAHAVRDPLGRAYNRTSHLAERRKMIQRWADYLGSLKQATQAVPPNPPQ